VLALTAASTVALPMVRCHVEPFVGVPLRVYSCVTVLLVTGVRVTSSFTSRVVAFGATAVIVITEPTATAV